MRLYGIFPIESAFAFNGPNAPPVYLKGVWLGSPGREQGFLNTFVPVVVGESEPEETAWGLKRSKRLRPKIAANVESKPGWIAFLTSYTGDGPIVGRVFIAHDSLRRVLVLAHGVGGKTDPPIRYWEYLVKISGPAEFLVQGTQQPRKLIVFDEEEVRETAVNPKHLDEEAFVLLSDSVVPHWKGHPDGKSPDGKSGPAERTDDLGSVPVERSFARPGSVQAV